MPQTFHVGSRSLLVNTLSWLLMLAGVLGLLSPVGLLAQPLPAPRTPAYLPWLMAALVLLSGVALAGGVGLLQRFDWGRRLCIALLMLSIPLLIGAIWIKFDGLQQAVQAALPGTVQAKVGSFELGLRLLLAALALWLSAAMGWAALRLGSSGVRQEFA
jgi:hypothetical protein